MKVKKVIFILIVVLFILSICVLRAEKVVELNSNKVIIYIQNENGELIQVE